MPISQESLDTFLNKVLAPPPVCKGVDPQILREMIYNVTGAEYKELTESRPHQLEGVAFALYMRKAMLFYWMRLGKTKIALDWAAHLRRANLVKKKGLIIAHGPIGVDVWEAEAGKHSPLHIECVRAGEGAADKMLNALDGPCHLLVISRSMAQSLFTYRKLNRKKQSHLYPDSEKIALMADLFDHCIIDETHFYSSPFGMQVELIRSLVNECKFRLGLTGTPVGRHPEAIWSQAMLIDDGLRFGYVYPFFEQAFGKLQYSHFRRSKREYVFDKKKMDLFQYKLDSFSLSYGKGEVKSAEVFEGQVRLKLLPQQKEAYNDAVAKLIKMHAGDYDEIEATFIRLRQISSGYLPFTNLEGKQQIRHFPSAKIEWLKEFASEVSPTTPCLIFHEYVHTGELICKALDEAKVSYSWIYGQTKDKSANIAQFRSGKVQFLVANAQTGGTSIDLPEADYLCFFESPCSPIQRSQAAARPMARGDRLLVMDDLVCSPVEDKILGFIKEGNDLLKRLLGGGKKTTEELFSR